jgi:hypothetical protein
MVKRSWQFELQIGYQIFTLIHFSTLSPAQRATRMIWEMRDEVVERQGQPRPTPSNRQNIVERNRFAACLAYTPHRALGRSCRAPR